MVLCRFVWVNKCWSILLVPSRSSSMPLYPQSALSQGTCPNSLLFHCFHFIFIFECIKELGSASPNMVWKNIFNVYFGYVQSLTQIKNVFPCSKHSNLKNGQYLFFTKCATFFLKIGKDFNIDDYKGKRIWNNDLFFL